MRFSTPKKSLFTVEPYRTLVFWAISGLKTFKSVFWVVFVVGELLFDLEPLQAKDPGLN